MNSSSKLKNSSILLLKMAFLSSRICRPANSFLNLHRTLYFSPKKDVRIIPQKATAPLDLTHDEKNEKLKRPQSPHLSIYQVQLTSLLSISHRFAGVALSSYALILAGVSLSANQHVPELIHSYQGISPVIATGVKALIALPMCYHYANGIRHLVWDLGKALTIKGVYNTGYLAVAFTLIGLFVCLSL